MNANSIEFEAVLFISESAVCAQYKMDEFDSLLDGIFKAPEYTNQTLDAVFVQLDHQLCLRRLVFFNLSFEADGSVDFKWNLPLRQLAEQGINGPTFKGQTLQIYHPKNNTNARLAPYLWMPLADDFKGLMSLIIKSIERNSLGFNVVERTLANVMHTSKPELALQAESAGSSQSGHSAFSQEATIVDEHEVAPSSEDSHQQINRQLRNAEQSHRQKIQQVQRKCNQLEVQNDQLAGELLLKTEHLEDIEFKYAQLNDRLVSLKDEHLHLLRLQNQALPKVDSEDVEHLHAKLQLVQSQLEQALSREQLVLENNVLVEDDSISADQLVEQMIAHELVFTVYHSGAGHFNLSARSISSYLDNPHVYAAQKCAVRLQDYEIWLKHFEEPRCQTCNKKIDRIGHPSEFHANMDVYCSEHKPTS